MKRNRRVINYIFSISLTSQQITEAAHSISLEAQPLAGLADDYDILIERIGDRHLVLLGEGSHGTHEFYTERARITKRLIKEKGFNAIAVEGDWPDAAHINSYILGGPGTAEESLGSFERFPRWMWRNRETLDLIKWLRAYNDTHPEQKVGFYGLDLYGLYPAISEIISYLETVDEDAAEQARQAYSCFGTEVDDGGQEYGRSVHFGVSEPCRRGAIAQLVKLRRSYLNSEEHFIAEENAKLIADAEEYYRSMFQDPRGSWNLRDRHMADTLDHLLAHLDRRIQTEIGKSKAGKVVVWAHNSHVSDARATSARNRGELTLGQLIRERHGDDVVLVGFTTYDGTVTAAHDWGREGKIRDINPGHSDSIERLFRETKVTKFVFVPSPGADSFKHLNQTYAQRAIGVIYRPETERQSHYMMVVPAAEFDAFIHINTSQALEPLDELKVWHGDEVPDTYPSAL